MNDLVNASLVLWILMLCVFVALGIIGVIAAALAVRREFFHPDGSLRARDH